MNFDPMTPEQLQEHRRQLNELTEKAMIAAGYKPVEGCPGLYSAEITLPEPLDYIRFVIPIEDLKK